MRALITGVGGFIGSRLAEKLLEQGWTIIGVDSLTDYYPVHFKIERISKLNQNRGFQFIEKCIMELDLNVLFKNIDYVFHLAGQPGVRASWGENFDVYTKNNILTTQRLLESAISFPQIKRFIYASSSSLYGDAGAYPTFENMLPKPVSPYGVSKLAAENLCYLYNRNYSVPTISLRYFTVYGPGQRPDMSFHILFRAVLEGRPFHLYGDGSQTRDFTYVDDIVAGTILATEGGRNGEAYNIGGGSRVSMLEILDLVEEITERKPLVKFCERQKGDAMHTAASIEKAYHDLGYRPRFKLKEGLFKEWEWLYSLNV